MKHKTRTKALSWLLSLAMLLSVVPGMSLTAYATPTETLLTTITATAKEQASYSTANVATVSFSYTAYGSSAYLANWGWWGYGWTAKVNAAEGYTITKCVFYDDADRTATDSEAPFVVETTEEDKTPKVNGTPIKADASKGIKKIEVYGYVTPAASYSVTVTAGDHMTKTAGSGDAEQTGLTGAMTDVVYTADNGYYYPTDYSVAEVSGIKVTRDSYTQITVSGTPTADATITLTAPTAKTTPAAPTTAAAVDCTTSDNNDGKLTGVTTAMEYKKSDAESWTVGTGSDITGFVPGTYYVRVKATDTTNASGSQELTIKGFISYTVTFKVVNGKWNEGEGDAATADKTVTLTGHDGDTLKLTADQIPAVGSKPNDNYKAGSWNVVPSAETEITAATTYTYTYAAKAAQTITAADVTATYGDTGVSISASVTDPATGGGAITYAVKAGSEDYIEVNPSTGALTIKKVPTDGKAYVTVTAAETETYAEATKDVTVTVNTKEMTVSASGYTGYYDGSAHGITVTVSDPATGATVKYGEAEGTYDLTDSPTQTEAGTKTVYYQVTADNYTTYTGSATITVNAKQTQTITAENVTATYGDTGKSVIASVTTPATGGGAISYAVKDGSEDYIDVASDGKLTIKKVPPTDGKAYVIVTAAETDDYAETTKEVTVTISKAEPTATAPAAAATYGQTLAAVTLTNPTGNTAGAWAWVEPSTSVGNVGTNTFKANFTPTDTGNYNSMSNVDVTVTVAKATPTATAPTATATYGQTLANVTLTNPDSNTPGTWAWADSTQSVGNVVSPAATFKANFTPTDTTNYSAVTGVDVTVTVNKANATVAAPPTAKENLTFNGGDQALVNAGTANGGTMQYALGTASAATGDYSADIPTGKAAQTYYVWYKIVGDANHNDSAAAKVSVTIGPTPLTAQGVTIYAIPDQNSTGEQIKPKPVVKHLGYLLKENEDYTLSYGENKTVGTATGSVTVTGKGGYSGTLNKTFNIILPAYSGALTVTAPGPYTYGTALGAAPTVNSTGSLSGERVTMYYATTPSGTGTAWSSSARLNAGTYYVWAEVAKTAAHDAATSERVAFIVTKAMPTAPSSVLAASYTDTYKVTLTIPSGKSYADYEYSTNNSTWTALPALKDGAFTPTDLSSNSSYTIYLRTKEDSNNNASTAATATLQTPAKVLLRYDANGSTASVPVSVEYDSGTTVTAAAAISRAGYTFASWNEAANGGTAHAESSTFSITANTTLYAQWTPNSYTVQYNANGGEGTISNGTFTYGTAAALSDGTGLSRSGYTFRGWATSASGNVVYGAGQSVSNLTTEIDGMITLYAVWTQNTYEVSGTVMEELDGTTDKSIVAGVAVKIVRGNVEFAATTTGDDGTYKFSGVPAGTYNIVATRTVDTKTQTMTALVEVKDSDKSVDTIVLPPSRINSVLSVADNTPPVMVGGLEEVAKDEAESAKDVTVTMTVEKKDESTVAGAEEIKEAVAANASTDSGNTALDFLDVSVTKKVDNGAATPVTETSQVVEIIVSFNMNGRFGFSLYRHHDGKAEPFLSRSGRFDKNSFKDGYYYADKANGLFYIYTNRFSTYAIGYEEGTSYTVTVSSGTGGGDYAAGATVTITADAAPSGKVFDKWTASGVTLTNASSATTTFTMPAKNVSVTATYKTSGGGTSSSSSGGSSDSTITVPVSGDSASVSVSASVSGSTATVKAPTTAQLDKVIGESVKTGDVTIDVSGLKKDIATVSIPTETVKAIEKAVSDPDNDADALTVKLTDGSVTFDAKALAAVVDQAKGSTVQLNLDNIGESKLKSAQKTAIKDMDVQAVYDAYMTSNGQRISDFKGGKAAVTVSYTLKDGQTGRGVVVWYVADDGKTTEVPTAYNDKTVSFTVEHFSNYVIAYDAQRAAVCPKDDTCPISAFSDASATAWYHDGVHYVLESGIMNGVGNGKFGPGNATSRAMIAQILWNMEGRPVVNYAMSYTDVDADAWYAEAVRWATAQGIMNGYGGADGGKFGPNDDMTREQLVTIMYRYAQMKKVDVSIGEDTNILSYDDALQVSEWAIPAMQWAVGAEIVNGTSASTLSPKNNASRAEIATIVMRYCEKNAK